MTRFILFCCIIISGTMFAQITNVVKGKVVDKETGIGLPGVIVQMKSTGGNSVVVTDNNGFYKFTAVPVGRQSFLFTYTSYKPVPLNDVTINSGKEVVFNIDMEESTLSIDEVVVTSGKDTDVVSTMQISTMKSFNIEETERYAGSRQDPARMVANFAGIQGTNDSRNDIVVRGNSPAGLLWRLEDVDIPNPNHFAIAGSAGGPQALINNKYLANSEFYNGAFPSNYGNALGGVFDLRMRNGNNEKHEGTVQLGILGVEAALEGPISKKSGATYIATYRYSTLDLLKKAPLKFGTSAIPAYQDFGLRLSFPTKKAGIFTVSSIGGASSIKIILSDVHEKPKELYGDQNRDQYFTTNMGVGILGHLYQISSRTIVKTSLAFSRQYIESDHYQVIRDKNYVPNDTLPHILGSEFTEKKATIASYIKTKINARNSLKIGFFINRFDVDFKDSIKINSLYDTMALAIQKKPFKLRENAQASFFLVQPYVQFVHKFSEKLSLNAGLFSQILTLNGSTSIEPRASLKYQLKPKQALSLSYGLHSQMQQTYLYYAAPDTIITNGSHVANTTKAMTNRDLDFTKSQHLVFGYDVFIAKYLKVKTELYYQQLWNAPVYVVPSSVSALNRGATFTKFMPMYTMTNKGTGTNYGVELTVEKLFSHHYYFMANGSLYNSTYEGSDGRTNSTDFNGNFMVNILGGVEYPVGKAKRNSMNYGVKLTYGGGKRYSPVNRAASDAVMDIVPQDDKVNTLQFDPYHRFDIKIGHKFNRKRTFTEVGLDLINIFSVKNVLALSYAPDPSDYNKNPVVPNYQLGFLPLFYVKVDF